MTTARTKASPSKVSKKQPAKPAPVKSAKRAAEASGQSAPPDASAVLAVIADPHNDKPRLAYADQLAKAGDPRGEFIKIQCLLGCSMWGADGRLGQEPDIEPEPANSDELYDRQMELFKKHAKTWVEPARPYLKTWSWRRGFLDRCEAGPKFMAGAARVLAAHPIHLELQGMKSDDIKALADAPLHDLRFLELVDQPVTVKNIGGFLGKNLSKLLLLDLSNSKIDDDGVVALATKSHLGSLRRLRLTGSRVGDDGAVALAGSQVMTNLEEIDIENTGVASAGIAALTATRLPRLKKVILGQYVTKAAGKAAVAALKKRFEVVVADS